MKSIYIIIGVTLLIILFYPSLHNFSREQDEEKELSEKDKFYKSLRVLVNIIIILIIIPVLLKILLIFGILSL